MNDPIAELNETIQKAMEDNQITGTPLTSLTKGRIEESLRQSLIGRTINKTSVIVGVEAEQIGDTSEYSVALTLDPPLDYFTVELPEGVVPDDEEAG